MAVAPLEWPGVADLVEPADTLLAPGVHMEVLAVLPLVRSAQRAVWAAEVAVMEPCPTWVQARVSTFRRRLTNTLVLEGISMW